jgi:hypothetical protein
MVETTGVNVQNEG